MRNPNYEALRTLMLQDLYRVMRRVPAGSLQEQRAWLSDAVSDLVLVYGSNFASIAATELEVARMGRGEMALPVVVAAAAGREQVDAAVGWALSMGSRVIVRRSLLLPNTRSMTICGIRL